LLSSRARAQDTVTGIRRAVKSLPEMPRLRHLQGDNAKGGIKGMDFGRI